MEAVSRSEWRDAPPNHFRFKIESFSRLSSSWSKRYESGIFNVGSYKWKLALYPNGNTQKGDNDHLSLYLVLAPDSHAKLKKEILVSYTLLLFDHVRERFFLVQDMSKLDKDKSELGFDKFLPLKNFVDPSNGFLVDDTCMFGADIFVMDNTPEEHCLSMMPSKPTPYKHSWKVEKFSKLEEEKYYSGKFSTRGHQWKVLVYPKGNGKGKGSSVSLFLELADAVNSVTEGSQVLTEYKLRIVDQLNKNHKEETATCCFTAASKIMGYQTFLPLANLNKLGAGYLVDDACTIEAEVIVLGSANSAS